MILFLDDWKKYPGAIPHVNTSNRTWVRMAALYKGLGIKNFYFHLALLDRRLEFVDTYDPDIDNATRALIRKECTLNPWYYLREIARIKPQASNRMIPVNANRGNLSMWWLFLNHITVFLMQIRQTGKSVSADKIIEWVLDFGGVNSGIALYTKDDDLRVKNVERIKHSRKLVPEYLYVKTSKDTDNSFEVTNKTLGNYISTFVAQKDKTAANNRGRGMTVPIVVGDEGPFSPNVDITISAMLGATSAARAEARESNRPYGNIFMTTAGDRSGREGRFMYSLFKSAMPWSETLLDCETWAELHERVKLHTKPVDPGFKPVIGVSCVFNHLQLGYSDEWLSEVLDNVTGTDDEINKDYFNRWGSGGRNNPIDKDVLAIISSSEMEAKYVQAYKNMYNVYWYVSNPFEYIQENHCVIGMDSSDGVGGDAIVNVIVDSRTLETVGVLSINETNIFRYTDFIASFMLQHANTTLIPERKSTGKAIVDGIIISLFSKGINPFTRIFNRIVNEQGYDERFTELAEEVRSCMSWRPEQFDQYAKYFGYTTSGSGMYSRTSLYEGTLIEAAKKAATVIRDKNLISELAGLEVRNNRIDHGSGKHDDTVVSWLLTCWFLMFGRNLKFYGIHGPLSRVKNIEKLDEDPSVTYARKTKNNIVRSQLEELIKELKYSRDPIIIKQIHGQIESLRKHLSDEIDINSINEMYEELKHTRHAVINKRLRDQKISSRNRLERRSGGLYGFNIR